MKKKSWINFLYTIIYLCLFSFIQSNYNGSLKTNIVLFIVQGVLLLGYISWTIVHAWSKYRQKKDYSDLVIGVCYSLALAFIFFAEIDRYMDYVRIMEIV